MTKWEYAVVGILKEAGATERELDRNGLDGWEAVCALGDGCLILMKRPLPTEFACERRSGDPL